MDGLSNGFYTFRVMIGTVASPVKMVGCFLVQGFRDGGEELRR